MTVVAENPVEVARISSEQSLKLVHDAVQHEIESRVRKAELVKIRAGLALSPLTTAECAGRMARLSAEVDTLVMVRDKLLPSIVKVAPEAIAETIASVLDNLDDDEYGC